MPDEKNTTRNTLADSAVRLVLSGIPFEKLTIKQITDGAKLIRPTFYHHFIDKYEMLEWIFKSDVIDPARALIEVQYYREAFGLMLKRIEKHRLFYECVLKLEGQNSFASIMENTLVALLREILLKASDHHHHLPLLTADNLALFYGDMLVNVLQLWIKNREEISVHQVTDAAEYLCKHSILEVLGSINNTNPNQ